MVAKQLTIERSGTDPAEGEWTERWVHQHTSLERYTLVWFVSFPLLRKLGIPHSSTVSRLILLLLSFVLFLVVPLAVTLAVDRPASMPLAAWTAISAVFGATYLSYDLYAAIGDHVCSIARTVRDPEAMKRQLAWDRRWYSLRISGLAGLTVAAVISLSMAGSWNSTSLPAGSFVVIALLSYQPGELACNNLLMCFEARNFSKMNHDLYRFDPLSTFDLQRAIKGYGYFGLTTALVVTIYIASSALLLPDPAYLTNPAWLGLMLCVYLVLILGVVVPRRYVETIVRRFKERELRPLRKRFNRMFDRVEVLTDDEYADMLRTEKVQKMVQETPDSCLPYATIGRLLGTLLLPTLTFVLAVAGELYLTRLFEGVLE